MSLTVYSEGQQSTHAGIEELPGIWPENWPGLQLPLLLFGCEIVLQYSLAGFPC